MKTDMKIFMAAFIVIALFATGVAFAAQTTEGRMGCEMNGADYTAFADRDTEMSFCYDQAWGDVVVKETGISPEARVGTKYYLTFTDSRYPLLAFATLDFAKLGDSDVPQIVDWKGLDFEKSNAELLELLPEDENSVISRGTINGKQYLKVEIDYIESFGGTHVQLVKYFTPNVNYNDNVYNFYAIGTPDMEESLQAMIRSMEM